MLVGVVDSERQVVYRSTAPSHGLRQDELLETLERELRAACEARPDVVAAGLGIPCTIDRRRGVAIMAVNLELAGVPIRDLMKERLGLPVLVDNDANVAILAEHRFGAARGARNAAMLTIGTGIGGGLIVDGRVYRGSTGAGAELGHTVIDVDGPRCRATAPTAAASRRWPPARRSPARASPPPRPPPTPRSGRRWPRAPSSTARRSRTRRSPVTRPREACLRRSGGGWGWRSRASPSSRRAGSSPTRTAPTRR